MVDKNQNPLTVGQEIRWIDRKLNQIRKGFVHPESAKWSDEGHDILTIEVRGRKGTEVRNLSYRAVRVIGGKGSPLGRMGDTEKDTARLIRRECLRAVSNAPDLTPFLTDDLRRAPWKDNANPLAGHCYVASEVHYHMWAKKFGFRPFFLRWENAPHWYLQDAQGNVLDATAGQFSTTPDYAQGKGKGFLTKLPSKRARAVMGKLPA